MSEAKRDGELVGAGQGLGIHTSLTAISNDFAPAVADRREEGSLSKHNVIFM